MGSIPPELSLDLAPSHVPKSIRDFLKEISPIDDSPLKAEKVGDFIRRLEDEMRKIEGFKRELPLCMLLLEDAIQSLKEESTQSSAPNVEPVLEEFIPLKKVREEDADINRERDCMKDKMNWMSSVQLWKNDGVRPGDPHQKLVSAPQAEQVGPLINEESEDPLLHCKWRVAERAFVPFKGYTSFPSVSKKEDHGEDLPTAGLSLLTPGTRSPTAESGLIDLSSELSCTKTARSNVHPVTQPMPTNQNSRKQRRCWSPELHRRFVNALQQLGGSQVATPKQIKELMQVDGLTNDEVKSHLQKYRLHTRRHPGHPSSPSANQPMVVLGGLWMAPENHNSGSPKGSGSQSGSPQGPFQLTGNASMEDEDDDRSESCGWKSRVPKLGKVDV